MANDGGNGGDNGSGDPNRFPGDRPRNVVLHRIDTKTIKISFKLVVLVRPVIDSL